MDYKIISNSEEECFIEVIKNSFRTRIELDWTPEKNFSGVAVGCNYSFKGHPVGFLKDNGLVRSVIDGRRQRAVFCVDETDTIIQAGPSLLIDEEPQKDFKAGGFATHFILSGLHSHIGKKKNGNYIIGFTNKLTFNQMIEKYQSLQAEDAIKLPGLKYCSYIFQSRMQTVKHGLFPIPVALIFEPRIKEAGNLLNDVTEPVIL